MGVFPIARLPLEIYIYSLLNTQAMTHQEFNHIYYLFTQNEKGIKPSDRITTTGEELKEFVEFSLAKLSMSAS